MPGIRIADDGMTAVVSGDAEGLFVRVSLVLDRNGESGLYTSQSEIGEGGVIVLPALHVPGLIVTGINAALVPTLGDIQSPTPKVIASDAVFVK